MFIDIQNKNILIWGCGGGYDIYCGLVMYFDLIKTNNVRLGSFSFTRSELLTKFDGPDPNCFIIDHTKHHFDSSTYFPEWILSKHIGQSVYAVSTDIHLDSYEKSIRNIIAKDKIDVVIVVDGGCDAVLTGLEEDLATPVEDMMTVYVVNKLKKEGLIQSAYLTCLGATVERVNYSDFEQAVERIGQNNGFVNSISLRDLYLSDKPGREHVVKYMDIFKRSNPTNSIINSSVVSAIEGFEGQYENPLLQNRISLKQNFPTLNKNTSILWVFDLETVAKEVIYLDRLDVLKDTDDIDAFIIGLNYRLHPEGCRYDLDVIYTRDRMNKVRPIIDEIVNKCIGKN
jgi:hypothetical protein